MSLLISILLAALAWLTMNLQNTYAAVPSNELKRRARAGDEVAGLLFRVVAYGATLRFVLWLLVGVTWGLFFVYVAQHWTGWLAVLLAAVLMWTGIVYRPGAWLTRLIEWLAARLASPLAWTLSYLHPLVDRLVAFVRRHRPIQLHTGLYDRDDLVELLAQQRVQVDNRIEQTELEVALHALTFGDYLIREIMTPRRVVTMVSADEAVGPVLMAELHKSGHSRFLVYDDQRDNIVGMLYARDLPRIKTGGKVRSAMHADEVYFIHEEQSIAEALQAMLKTRRQLFVVVNSFEEFVGIVSLEDVLERIIGRPIVDEFDQYDNLRAVAARFAKADHQAHKTDAADTKVVTEVIE